MAKERVLLKISGESLSGEGKTGHDRKAMDFLAKEILTVKDLFELAIVVGGGNLIRGTTLKKEVLLQDGVVADYAGMVATIINAAVFQNVLEEDFGLETRVASALEVKEVAELFIRRKVISHLNKGRVVLLAAGTGKPDFSTDTAMVLNAHEIGAKIILKGTKVDGIFDRDPKKDDAAVLIPNISYIDYLNRNLNIVDTTAVTLARNHSLRIKVFNIFKEGNLRKILTGENIGSEIS
ncbi:MAG: UMP kinase [Candidatus Yanofskybacteria bacterium]|nr:UMP kinase [Candidatus Yanofskybacteria bacterium]